MTSIKKIKALCESRIANIKFTSVPFPYTHIHLCNDLFVAISIPIKHYLYMDNNCPIDINVEFKVKHGREIRHIHFSSDGEKFQPNDNNLFDSIYAYMVIHYEFDLFDFNEEIKPFLQIYRRQIRELRKRVLIEKGL